MSEDGQKELLKAQLRQMENMWQRELAQRQARESLLESELLEVKACLANAKKSDKREAELLWRRVKTVDTLLSYLKSKARIMAIPRFASTSCGIKCQEGVGLVDKKGVPMADWCKDVNLSLFERPDLQKGEKGLDKLGCLEQGDGEYIEQIVKAVMLVTDVMEVLLKRAIMAEAEMGLEKEKAKASQDEVKRKALQIESMWARVEEMEKVATGTNVVLKEMQQKLEDMEQETSRQRQRATENEQELSRVRHDFEVLRSSIDSLVSARETLLSSEKQIQEMEKIFERLTARTAILESVNRQKEAEVSDLLTSNDKLRGMLDLKESQLVAMKEQCKLIMIQSQRSKVVDGT